MALEKILTTDVANDGRIKINNMVDELVAVKSTNTTIQGNVSALETKLATTSSQNTVGSVVYRPSGFSLTGTNLDNRIFTDGNIFWTDYNVSESKAVFGATYYVDPINGSNANAGTKEAPMQSIKAAYDKSDVGTIMLKGGNHFRYNSTWLTTVSKNINIIGYDGTPKLIMADKLTFVKNGTYGNVYEASRAGVGNVVDISKPFDNGYKPYKKVTSIADVNATIYTWYSDGTKVYVNSGGVPDSNNVVGLLISENIKLTGTMTYFYIENCEVIGGARPFRSEAESCKVYAINTKFIHSAQTNGNGVEIVGGDRAIFQNCVASHNYMDGFNYHKGLVNSTIPYFIEIDCIGSNNGSGKGTAGSQSNNGSTAHDGVKGIRVNGTYAHNDGGNVADVNAGTETWNLGVTGFESYQTSDFQTTTGAKMWLDNCKGFGSTNSIESVNAEDRIYIRRGEYVRTSIAGVEVVY
ncbi:hypothetical protein [Macrococcoides caseolyticum]|uniref:hypothetical protein n=1 Tax=Macrococcoides caseolyticum TaxID=69966 RepID=UPI001F3FB814|nr:hypothetical protein [Macrococcus caseolyticus]MCE4957723.1 hypothetical protein [Macrococcus caseolyticus]